MREKLSSGDSYKALLLLNKLAIEPWEIQDGKLSCEFSFRNFIVAFEFMTEVAHLVNQADHHPEWSNTYNKVKIQLISHDVKGLSLRDFMLATEITKVTSLVTSK